MSEVYNELAYYTLSLKDERFILQYVVDAWAAQNARETSKPIQIAFALIGLYLHIERGFSGREVQLAHMTLAAKRKDWPRFPFPIYRGDMIADDVLKYPPGRERYEAINRWSKAVWDAWKNSQEEVRDLATELLPMR